MGLLTFRKMASCVLVMAFPASLFAADSGAAMIYAHGAAWLNGTHVPASSAIFTGDRLQVRSDSSANINAQGSSITVVGDSLVEFEGASLKVERGGVAVATSKGIATTVGDVRVVPAANAWTEFSVTDSDGTVKISARKGDLTITDDKGTELLAQGQETTRDDQQDSSGKADNKGDKKKSGKRADGPAPAANGGLLNSKLAIGLGAAAITGVSVWALTSRTSDEPVSPSTP
jgi:hypothetical protein